MNNFTKEELEEKLLGIVSVHLGQAVDELFKIKNVDSDLTQWHEILKNIYLDIQSRVEYCPDE